MQTFIPHGEKQKPILIRTLRKGAFESDAEYRRHFSIIKDEAIDKLEEIKKILPGYLVLSIRCETEDRKKFKFYIDCDGYC